MSKIGFLGTGHIAAPLARRMVRLGHDVIVTERNAAASAELAEHYGVSVGDAQAVLDTAEVVFICLRPAVAPDILSELTFKADHQIISVMAEIESDRLSSLCAPAGAVTRTIPFGFAETGGCPLPVWGPAQILHDLFSPDNIILEMDKEDDLNAVLTASAFVASQLDLLHTVARWTEDQISDAATAETYIRSLVSGYLNTMPQTNGTLAAERDALTLPGSLNHYVMDRLRQNGTHADLSATLETVYERLTRS